MLWDNGIWVPRLFTIRRSVRLSECLGQSHGKRGRAATETRKPRGKGPTKANKPRGRPPKGKVWYDGGWIPDRKSHTSTRPCGRAPNGKIWVNGRWISSSNSSRPRGRAPKGKMWVVGDGWVNIQTP